MSRSIDQREPIEALAEEFMERKRRGEQPTVEEFVARHPQLADEIRDLFPALVVMENLGNVSSDATGSITGPLGRVSGMNIEKLGDYRILREIGRGGMGVVFEAEQESLGRRVALKVLSSSAVIDAKQVRRFEREAKSAARLHHTNIVPVFGVGHQDGHYYYVMQFIQGQSLDLVLDELRRLKRTRSSSTTLCNASQARRSSQPDGVASRLRSTIPDEFALTAADVANSLLTGRFAEMNLLAPGLSRTDCKEGVTEGQQGVTEALATDALSQALPERSTAAARSFACRDVASLALRSAREHLGVCNQPLRVNGSLLSVRVRSALLPGSRPAGRAGCRGP